MTEPTDSTHLDTAAPVREGEALDTGKLAAYLAVAVPGCEGPLTVEQFPKGHSNLTYLLRMGERQLVLRRPPPGAGRIKKGHDMGREHRMLSALIDVYPRVPRPLHYCDDASVIGAPFYVMERVSGIILRGAKAPRGLSLDEAAMHRLSTALVDNLAALHEVDASATGLTDTGKPEGYVERQVRGWTDRYLAAKTDDIPDVERAAGWLAEHAPPDVAPAVIHNDYKYDNLVLDPVDLGHIVAVLDWEMATFGDPLMDLGTTLGYWIDPSDPDEFRMMPLGPTLLPGNLTRAALVDRYERTSGRRVEHRVFYYVYGLFKIAGIAQQIYRRFVDGFTQDPRFGMMIMGVRLLGQQAARAIERDRLEDLG